VQPLSLECRLAALFANDAPKAMGAMGSALYLHIIAWRSLSTLGGRGNRHGIYRRTCIPLFILSANDRPLLKFASYILGLQEYTMSFSPGNTHRISICLLGIALGGCATTTVIRSAQGSKEQPIKVLVMQSPMKVDAGRLQKVLAPNIKRPLSLSDKPIVQGVQQAQQYASKAMDTALDKQPKILIVTPPANDQAFLKRVRGQNLETAISQSEADSIRQTTGANALLRFQITDYGLTPRSWRTGYITFEVTSTLALAGVIAYAGTTVAKAAAGAYLVQEGVEETAETYAGFWGVDVAYRPVRMEAELIRLDPIETVWKSSDTGLSDLKLSRLMRKVDSIELDNQLDQATNDAANTLVANLSTSLNHITHPK